MPAVCVGGGRGGCQIRVALSCLLGMVYALEPSCQELWNATESNPKELLRLNHWENSQMKLIPVHPVNPV